MKRHVLPLLLLAGIGVGCTLPWAGGISLKYDGIETSIDPVSAYVVPNSSGGHSIQITNYPVQLSGTYDYSKIRAAEEGHYRIDVAILKKQASSKQPIVPGEYVYQDPREEPRDKIVRATVYRFENGKETSVALDPNKLRGLVKIKSVEGEAVEGTIDVTDERSMVKGSFSAIALR